MGKVETGALYGRVDEESGAESKRNHVFEVAITYTPAFKLEALKAYKQGQTPSEIISETLEQYGEEALVIERHGKNSTGRKPAGPLTAEEELKWAKAKIKLLEAQVDLLKSSKRSSLRKRNDDILRALRDH
jgi:hypothetical protein